MTKKTNGIIQDLEKDKQALKRWADKKAINEGHGMSRII